MYDCNKTRFQIFVRPTYAQKVTEAYNYLGFTDFKFVNLNTGEIVSNRWQLVHSYLVDVFKYGIVCHWVNIARYGKKF